MEYNFSAWDAYQFGLLPLVMYREANNQPDEAIAGVGWVVWNRVNHPGWWGRDIPSVILKHWQFSSFNWQDPNAQRYMSLDSISKNVISIAFNVYWKITQDPTGGATFYHDASLSGPPAEWGQVVFLKRLGDLFFYKEA